MSECVVRMEMPESCKKCKATLCLWTIDDCEIMDTIAAVQDFRKENDDGFPDFCPIICQLPEGHGRLVDGDELYTTVKAHDTKRRVNQVRSGVIEEKHICLYDICQAQTIVPAEEKSQSPKPTDPVPIRDIYYVMTECDAKTGTVTYEPRERIEP